ncbi:DUF802 domain-containing protein [Stenotrophomonas sp. HITSZ_GD]|uniref:DUF802 domain-containing protein n=1 Tax=Stenotrophomonas sp. HITSZ_GD TaxID=3037248 RepID=UPI00240DC45A|nr:DUF802 domain-containing protein [Stenotrophomonas sp. HITSZ_GD]MDG2524000.1 DUF802 domain-containing protein [Stenotrophomonas sp. HITSZ_GD]
MLRNPLNLVVFLLGLLAIGWTGAGYVLTHPLAALVAAVIGACYLAGVLELSRYQRATVGLRDALADVDAAREDLGAWLARVPASLRHAVQLRIEGERVPLPAPGMTPYLVGLLVLLGMLGTLLGMMATLRGTGFALESAADLQSIRDSLAAPVKGLGFAFGTSIAGVASSAMLGLLSALCRRERVQVVEQLDACIGTSLQMHSRAHEQRQTFQWLQQQAALMPVLVERLQAMAEGLAQRAAADSERQRAHQEAFQQQAEVAQAALSATLERALRNAVAEGASAIGAGLQPVVDTTLAGLAREGAATQASVAQAAQQHFDALSAGFAAAGDTAAAAWRTAIDEQRQSNAALATALEGALSRFNDDFAQRSAGVVEGVSTRLETATQGMADAWRQALSHQEATHAALTEAQAQALSAAADTLERHSVAWVARAGEAQAALHGELVARDEQRLAQWRDTLTAAGSTLREDWLQAGAEAAQRQHDSCEALRRTGEALAHATQAQANATIEEVARLVQTAAAAPQAAAEVIAGLRQTLSESMARDNDMLAERSQMLATLDTLLDAVNHASTEQRAAIDALVATSADLLDRVGSRFAERVEAQGERIDAAAAQLAAGATEVASLGDAFGGTLQSFAAVNDALAERLQGIEQALVQSLARSDEQLAYYVAQAREVVDLSMLAQRQIVEELRQATGAAAA